MLVYEIKEYVDGNTVKVIFTDEETGFKHIRTVNAVFTDSEYDEALTIERVEQVAMGVQHKMNLGIITSDTTVLSTSTTLIPPPTP